MKLYLVEVSFITIEDYYITDEPIGIFMDKESAIIFAKNYAVKHESSKDFRGCRISEWEANDISKGETHSRIDYIFDWEE